MLPPVSNLKHPNAMVVKTSLDEFGLNRQPQLLQFQQDNQQPQPQQQQPQQQQPGRQRTEAIRSSNITISSRSQAR